MAAVALQVNDTTLTMGLAALPFRGRHLGVMISTSRPPLYTMHRGLLTRQILCHNFRDKCLVQY